MYAFITAGGFGLSLMAFSLYDNFMFYLFVILVVNACATAADTLYKTLMQENVPNEQRGRAMGSWVLAIGTAPTGHLEVGWVAGMLGAPLALLINGGYIGGGESGVGGGDAEDSEVALKGMIHPHPSLLSSREACIEERRTR